MSEETRSINPMNNDPRRVLRWPKWRTWKRIFLALLAIAVVGDIYLHVWVGRWVEERLAIDPDNPQKIAQMREFWKKPIEVPKEWANIKPPSQATIDAFKQTSQTWEDFKSNEPSARYRINKAYKENTVLSSEQDRAQYLEDVAKMEPYFAAIQKLSGVMKKEAESAASCFEMPELPPNWSIFSLMESMNQKALALYAAGNYDEAVDCYVSILPMMIVNPTCQFFDYWAKFKLLQKNIPEMEMALTRIHDAGRLRSWLETLQWAEPFLCVNIGDRADEYQVLESYWSFAKKSPLDLKSNPTAGDFIRENAKILIKNYNMSGCVSGLIDMIAMHLFDDKPTNGLMEFRIASDLDSFIITNTIYELIMLRSFSPIPSQRIQDYESQGTLLYDVLRLRVAAQLYELETGKKVSATRNLVPDYLPKEIILRKSGKSFAWDAKGQPIVPAFQ
jgi:hypothetical protein